jgi:geranylgeranyl pyrophosphate synthase
LAHGVNIGDIFIPLSALAILEGEYTPATKIRLFQILTEYGLEVAEGQGLDINLRRNDDPTLEDYVACTRKKTGAFLAMATVGGGIIGGASEKHLENLRQFALNAGVAFQIKDDVLDYIGGKGRMTGSDILEGKRTTLAVFAALQASRAEKTRMMEILNKPWTQTSESEVAWVHDLYRRTQAHQKSEEMAERVIEEALDHLMDLPESAAKYRFLRLSKYLTRRIH